MNAASQNGNFLVTDLEPKEVTDWTEEDKECMFCDSQKKSPTVSIGFRAISYQIYF